MTERAQDIPFFFRKFARSLISVEIRVEFYDDGIGATIL